MSTQVSKKLPDLDEAQTIQLIKEYTAKLLTLHERADRLWLEREVQQQPFAKKAQWKDVDNCITFLDLWKNMRPAARRLAQYVSQTIEHGRIDEITDLELRLRLPEYEHHYRFLEDKVKALSNYLQSTQASYPEKMNEIRQVLILS
jgi:hypothetical protein